MIVNLTGSKTVTVTPAVTKTLTSITVISELDHSVQKKVIAITKEVGQVLLWEGAAYDAIGQWTDTDVQNRLLELYNN